MGHDQFPIQIAQIGFDAETGPQGTFKRGR
jgi:hypothetical protein